MLLYLTESLMSLFLPSSFTHHAQIIVIVKGSLTVGAVHVYIVLVGATIRLVRERLVATGTLIRPVVLDVHVLMHGAHAAKLPAAGVALVRVIHDVQRGTECEMSFSCFSCHSQMLMIKSWAIEAAVQVCC